MNASCCVCFGETFCYWKCSVCCDGYMCLECRNKIEITEDLEYNEPVKCPICRTPNTKDANMRELFADNFYCWGEDEEHVKKHPVLLRFMEYCHHEEECVIECMRNEMIAEELKSLSKHFEWDFDFDDVDGLDPEKYNLNLFAQSVAYKKIHTNVFRSKKGKDFLRKWNLRYEFLPVDDDEYIGIIDISKID